MRYRNSEIDELVRAVNPILVTEAAGGVEEGGFAAKERVWGAAQREVRSDRSRWGRRRIFRGRFAVVAVSVLIAAATAGAYVASETLPHDAVPPTPGFAVDSANATFLGEQEGIRYFAAPGDSEGERCLVRVGTAEGFVRATTCQREQDFGHNGGQIVEDRLLSGSRQYGPRYLAGLLPAGITGVEINGTQVEVKDGFFMSTTDKPAPTMVRVTGPGASAAAEGLMPALRQYVTTGPAGVGYSVLVTPAPQPSS